MIHTIIFDVGGTLIGGADLFETAAGKFPENLREQVSDRMIHHFFHHFQPENEGEFLEIRQFLSLALKDLSREMGLSDHSSLATEILDEVFYQKAYLFDDTLPMLDYLLAQKLNLLIASDADAELLRKELLRFDLHRYFHHFAISGEIKSYKPSDKFVSHLRNHVTEPYPGILLVGDADVDVLTARKLGAKAALIDRKQRKSVPNYDYYITSLHELKEILLQNDGEGGEEKC